MAKQSAPRPLEPREFRSPEEIDAAITKLRRRIEELERLDVQAAVIHNNGSIDVARSNVRDAIREMFGENSPEFREHRSLDLWAGPMYMNMSDVAYVQGVKAGCRQTIGILGGLVGRLEEKKADFTVGATPVPSAYFDRLKLHTRIVDVSRDLFMDGHPWEAVFAAA